MKHMAIERELYEIILIDRLEWLARAQPCSFHAVVTETRKDDFDVSSALPLSILKITGISGVCRAR
jgi:hypothetical protein